MLMRIRKLVLYLLLACLPLQSVAGPAHLLVCDDATPAAADSVHVHDNGEEHSAHERLASQAGTFPHDCYQNYFFGVMPDISQDAGPTRIVFVPAGPAGFASVFPQRLERPPLPALAV